MRDTAHATRPGFALNPPNVITIARVLMVPLLVALIFRAPGGSLAALLVFAVAAASDIVDGHLARSRNDVTTFGKLMDPLADKLLIASALVALVILDRLPLWVAVLIVAREVAVTVLRFVAVRKGNVISASALGKMKMGLQIAMVGALVSAVDPAAGWVQALIYATVVITIASGLDYFARVARLGRHVLVRAPR